MNAIEYVVRTGAGVTHSDAVRPGAVHTLVPVQPGSEISFNLSKSDMRGYTRVGNDLHIELADGRLVVLENYFVEAADKPRFFISSDGALHEVFFAEGGDGVLFAEYGLSSEWGKWSPDDALIFQDRPQVASVESYAAGENDVSMLAAGLLGGTPLLGALGLAGATAVGAATIGGDGDGDGSSGGGNGDGSGRDGGEGGGGETVMPTVDETPIVIGGDGATEEVVITGTGQTGDEVRVTIGDTTLDTVIDADGTWSVTFDGDSFPDDGVYPVICEIPVSIPDGSQPVTLDGPEVTIDLTGPVLDVTGGTMETGDLINLASHPAGLTMTGAGEAGATVTVTIDGVSHDTVVGADGSWSVGYTADEIATGEYQTEVLVVSADSYGNSTTLSQTLTVDTVPNDITNDPISGGLVNGTEASGALTVSGTATAGATIDVTVAGVTQTVTADGQGAWSFTLPANSIADGEYDATIIATSVDAAGNSSSASGSVQVDTFVDPLSAEAAGGADQIVNAAEAAQGVTVTGTTEPGGTVSVTIDGITRPALVGADGAWQAVFEGGTLAPGEYSTTATVDTTDAAGNSAQLTQAVQVDTFVNTLDLGATSAGADGVVNAEELASGDALTLAGQVEAGSSVSVRFNGTDYLATVASDGGWTLDIPAADVPAGDYDASFVITATDAAGNTSEITETLHIDTVAPDAPSIVTVTQDHNGFPGITTGLTDDPQDVLAVGADGAITDVELTEIDLSAKGETAFFFDTSVPDGSDLMVSTSDTAGNTRSTYLVLDDGATGTEVTLDNAGLGAHNVEAVDLEFAEEAHLTLTEADVLALSAASDTLTVHGDSADQVTLSGATFTGTVSEAGESFAAYQLGEATVLIDDDITNVVI